MYICLNNRDERKDTVTVLLEARVTTANSNRTKRYNRSISNLLSRLNESQIKFKDMVVALHLRRHQAIDAERISSSRHKSPEA